jgi:hypothetical protein
MLEKDHVLLNKNKSQVIFQQVTVQHIPLSSFYSVSMDIEDVELLHNDEEMIVHKILPQ